MNAAQELRVVEYVPFEMAPPRGWEPDASPTLRLVWPPPTPEPVQLVLLPTPSERPAEYYLYRPSRWRLVELAFHLMVYGGALALCAMAKQTWTLPAWAMP